MVNPTLNSTDLHALKANVRGEVIRPGDAQYEEARKVWNGMIDRRPALIVRPATVEGVVASVNFAREHGLLVSVRGGGHNVAGHATNDGGMVIDLSAMKRIAVNAEGRTATAEGGVTWGELDAATQVYGLATPGGVFSKTGIAGLTLGGGYGWLRSKYGLSADNLLAAEVVTADGRVIHASQDENPDLLWGLRGGGGNFGIVTSFTYQLHPVGPEVMFVFAFHDGKTVEDMKRALRFYRDFTATAPDEVSTILALGQIPPDEHFPCELHRAPFVLFGGLYAGPVEEGRRALQPLLDFGVPLIDGSGVMPYVRAQQAFDSDYPDGMRYYWKSLNLTHLDEDAIDLIVGHARLQPSPFNTTDLWPVGGAVARAGAETGAFNGRGAAFLINPEANWVDPHDDGVNVQWVQNFIHDMAPFSDGSRYLNFAGFQEDGEAMMRKAFGPQYERLRALKQQYDPTNFLRMNQNVPPAAEDPSAAE
ncbi:MAG: FAD-binding oxidoreductase [Chloroflexi bacterium]|nr:FAD-binding oxidoreductase [Chloroflexota bacterium]